MPKGKKKGKKKSGKKDSKEKTIDNLAVKSDNEDDIFEDKEELLKEKLFKTNKEIEDTKIEIENQNERKKVLELECDRVRVETDVFTNYLTNREQNKKNNLVTLQDYHESMIEYHNNMRMEMLGEFDNRKEDMQVISDKKEEKILELENQIRSYDEVMKMREEQHNEIKELENQIKNIRCQQAAELEKMKVHLITEHQRFQQESNEKINEIARAAYKEALESLSNSYKDVESENRELRQEMLWTIKQNKLLNDRKIKLWEENRTLKEELQYAQDFASFRQIRQEKPKQLEEIKKK